MPISQELPNFDFSADLEDIAETRFKANLDKDSAKWQDALFAEYMKAESQSSGVSGSPIGSKMP